MSMKMSELVELRDLLDQSTGLSSISNAQREQLETASEIASGLLPCESCNGRGWTLHKDPKVRTLVQCCQSCDKYYGDEDAHLAATKTLFELLEDDPTVD